MFKRVTIRVRKASHLAKDIVELESDDLVSLRLFFLADRVDLVDDRPRPEEMDDAEKNISVPPDKHAPGTGPVRA